MQIASSQKSIVVRASSEDEKKTWITAISAAVEELNKVGERRCCEMYYSHHL
jgi:hypothetical protein